jgi:hypothetical protein
MGRRAVTSPAKHGMMSPFYLPMLNICAIIILKTRQMLQEFSHEKSYCTRIYDA